MSKKTNNQELFLALINIRGQIQKLGISPVDNRLDIAALNKVMKSLKKQILNNVLTEMEDKYYGE
jgi:hypothetical protein